MELKVLFSEDPAFVLSRAGVFLSSQPVHHNLILSILHAPAAEGDQGRYWIAIQRDDIVGVVLQSPVTFPATLTPMEPPVATAMVNAIAEAGVALPGVNGEAATAAAFAGQWSERTKSAAIPFQGNRLYEFLETGEVPNVEGKLRQAGPQERSLMILWSRAFHSENELKSMWDAYVGTCPGVAMRTRSDVLVDYLKKQYGGQLLSEPVRYIEHEYTPIPLLHPSRNEQDLFLYYLQKDNLPRIRQHMRDCRFAFEKIRQFEFESEFRLVALGNHGIDFDQWENMTRSGIGVEYGTLAVLNSFYIESEDQIARIRNTKSSKGLDVHFRIDEVADKLLVSPGSPSWFSSLVRNMLRRFGISDLCVENSSLADTL